MSPMMQQHIVLHANTHDVKLMHVAGKFDKYVVHCMLLIAEILLVFCVGGGCIGLLHLVTTAVSA